MRTKVGEAQGFTFYFNHIKPKTKRGKERIWISVRQEGKKDWRVSQALNYVSGSDILYVKDSI